MSFEMTPRERMGTIGSEPITEFRMALICAMRFWRGTSLAEGAFAIMREMERNREEF